MKKATTLILPSFVFPIFYSHAEPPDPESPLARMVTHSFESGNSSAFVSLMTTPKIITFSLISLLMIPVCQLTAMPQESESPLVDLVHGLYRGGNENIFISFRRELLFPNREDEDIVVTLPGGGRAGITTRKYDYFALLKDGPKYVLAFSNTKEIKSLKEFLMAEYLQGFDGQDHWRLTLGLVERFEQMDNVPAGASTMDRLTIIPAEEVLKGLSDQSVFVSFDATFREALSVLQLGRTDGSQLPPPITDGELEWDMQDGGVVRATIEGDDERPARIEFLFESSDEIIQSEINYIDDTLLITQKINQRVRAIKRYLVSSVDKPEIAHGLDVFVWKTYREDGRDLFATMLINSVSQRFNFTDSLDLQLLSSSGQSGRDGFIRWWLFAFLLLALAPLAVLRANRRQQGKVDY